MGKTCSPTVADKEATMKKRARRHNNDWHEQLTAEEFTQDSDPTPSMNTRDAIRSKIRVFPAVCLKKQDAVPRPNNYWIQLFEFYTIRWLMPLRLRRMSSDMTTRICGKRADDFLDVCMEFIAKMRSGYIESFKGLRRSSTEIHGVYDL